MNEIATGMIVGMSATTSSRTPDTTEDVIAWSRTVAILIGFNVFSFPLSFFFFYFTCNDNYFLCTITKQSKTTVQENSKC